MSLEGGGSAAVVFEVFASKPDNCTGGSLSAYRALSYPVCYAGFRHNGRFLDNSGILARCGGTEQIKCYADDHCAEATSVGRVAAMGI